MRKRIFLSILFVAIAMPLIGNASDNSAINTQQKTINPEKKPLYWVDPMEPNIHYSAPGKSRMGMELVPVYTEKQQTTNQANIPAISAKE